MNDKPKAALSALKTPQAPERVNHSPEQLLDVALNTLIPKDQKKRTALVDLIHALKKEDEPENDAALARPLEESVAPQPPVTPHLSMPGLNESSDSANGGSRRQPCEQGSGGMAVEAADKWGCRKCGCFWRRNPNGSWSLWDAEQKSCETCDNNPAFMDNIEPITDTPAGLVSRLRYRAEAMGGAVFDWELNKKLFLEAAAALGRTRRTRTSTGTILTAPERCVVAAVWLLERKNWLGKWVMQEIWWPTKRSARHYLKRQFDTDGGTYRLIKYERAALKGRQK